MTQQNTSLEDIWSQTVGDDPGPDPYANCDSCDQSCSNSGLDPAPANDNNIINDFLQKAISDGQSGEPTVQSIINQINSENRARAEGKRQDDWYNDMQGNNPAVINPNRPGGGSSSGSGMEVGNEGGNANPVGGGFVGGVIKNDSVSWDPDQDLGNFSAEGFFDGRQGAAEGFGIGAAALRQYLSPAPQAVASDNCSTTGGTVTEPAATGTTGALPGASAGGSDQGSVNNSRPSGTGIGGGGTGTAGGGSINAGPVVGNGTGTTGNAGGRGKR